MAKYKVGDKVRVRNDLKLGKVYGDMHLVNGMDDFIGKVVTIDRVQHHWYGIEGYEDTFWTDEMFECVVGHKNFKVGDRVIATDNIGKYHEAPGTIIEVTDPKLSYEPYLIRFDEGGVLYGKAHRLIEETPTLTPEPANVININVTVNNYENACWYCRKGGIVDLYLDGAMGICPNCKRVCNESRGKGFTRTNIGNIVVEFKPKPEKRDNKPLTNEEYQALPVGTKVFVVWCWNMRENCKDRSVWEIPGWGVKEKDVCRWKLKSGNSQYQPNKDYDRCFDVYLEEPERPIPEADDELPF